MTNTEIITNTLKSRGMTDDQLSQLLDAYKGDLPFHTIPEWSRRGYHVKADAAPLFTCDLWKHTNKPSRAAIEAATEAGEDVPEQSPHFYKKLSYIYSFAQVEKNADAPDLDTIKARFSGLPGLTLTVKGEKTGAPNVWFTGDVEKYADEIKAAGGIWSKKKSAYWVKPSTAPAPSIMEDAPSIPAPMQARPAFTLPPVRLALPAPARLLALPAPKADPEPAPAPVPGPWKKCSFYTIRRDKGDEKQKPHKVDGYTDGVYNYYAIGDKRGKLWHAIHPVYGLSVAYADSRKDAQEKAQKCAEQVQRYEAQKDARLQSYADMMKAAQDGGNLSLF
ncbi:hypothetical protein D1159_00235 [Pseudoflavonifractor sp. 524-17]|uniref:hypothetical protein n=1 Tax=Pseudoflavonifractor sp. 524-17 TaxID=2304577 RepID=UPI00137B3CB8|nr:hypothetical protein [Pseudoflavonifractor sp. 524-17]NCE63040.1 hypothetical protein [Pseudoflavonifractor sp. 524-17]